MIVGTEGVTRTKSYYRVMLGRKSAFAAECFAGGFIGVDYELEEDLSNSLPEEWRDFNRKYIPIYLASHPDKSRITAGLACGAVWTVCKGINEGDIALSPDGAGSYRVAEVTGGYYYVPDGPLPHRRKVRWLDIAIARSAMTEALRNSVGSTGTVCDISSYASEIEGFLKSAPALTIIASDPTIEDPTAFAMEKHLEAFLATNWDHTELAQTFSIFEEDGEKVGQQYLTGAGPIDILAISKDRKRLLVVELKRGRATDVVVGQILRYMGYVKSVIAEPDQTVEGAIIALEDDPRLRWALAVVPGVAFYRYEVKFKLIKT